MESEKINFYPAPRFDLPIFSARANGKFLITGEYFVLDGALALAVPLRFGQKLEVYEGDKPGILHWESREMDGLLWLLAQFRLYDLELKRVFYGEHGGKLQEVLQACCDQKPYFLFGRDSYYAVMQADFPRQWGLGTSSTLVSLLCEWADVDPYPVLFSTFGGSGYDLACARARSTILYRLENQIPNVKQVDWRPNFEKHLYFVYLGQKQDSREAIAHYQKLERPNKATLVDEISALTSQFLKARTLPDFEYLIRVHEFLVSETLHLTRARDLHFPDFWGEIKSLGAWGGDFVLATSDESEAETRAYFEKKGFQVMYRFSDMVLPKPQIY